VGRQSESWVLLLTSCEPPVRASSSGRVVPTPAAPAGFSLGGRAKPQPAKYGRARWEGPRNTSLPPLPSSITSSNMRKMEKRGCRRGRQRERARVGT
jgi:hypothetical protein